MIDFGLSEKLGESVATFGSVKVHHIAPEMFRRRGVVTVTADKDVYSLSAEMLRKHSDLPVEIRDLLELGCADNPSERPSLCEIIEQLWLVLLNSALENDKTIYKNGQSNIYAVFLGNLVKSLNLTGVRILLNIIDQYDEALRKLIQQSPVLVEAIVSRYQKDRDEFQDMSGYIVALFKANRYVQRSRPAVSSLQSNTIFTSP